MHKKIELPFRYAKMGRWAGKTTVRDDSAASGLRIAETEIDLLCIDKDAKEYLVGECKFKKTPFSYSEYIDMLAKLAPQKSMPNFIMYCSQKADLTRKLLQRQKKTIHGFIRLHI